MIDCRSAVQHLFQTALLRDFGLRVTVDFSHTDKKVDVCMKRQATLDEYWGGTNAKVLWTEAIITLSSDILQGSEELNQAYEEAHKTIKKAMEKGEVWP